jgi:hypothetical protein
MKNNSWNRWLLVRDLRSLEPPNRLLFLSRYPLAPTPDLLALIREELFTKHSYSVLNLLTDFSTSDSRLIFDSWVESLQKNPTNKAGFLATLPYVIKAPRQLVPLVRAFWPRLSTEERSKTLEIVAFNLDQKAAGAEAFLAFLGEVLKRQEVAPGGSPLAILGKFLGPPNTRDSAVSILKTIAPNLRVGDLSTALEELPPGRRPEVALLLYDALAAEHPIAALDAFQRVAASNISIAEGIAKPIIKGRDSTLKKGLIVILVQNNSRLGQQHIDHAFAGSAPRVTLFESTYEYVYGSRAGDRYQEISKHDYRENCKLWPPYMLSPKRLLQERLEWPRFIQQFPWFPGTDDAYFRLAYSHYATGHIAEAVTTILDYFSTEHHPDIDAEPYLQFLLRVIAKEQRHPSQFRPLLTSMDTLLSNPPGTAILSQNPPVQVALNAIDWFLARPVERRALGATERELQLTREIFLVLKAALPAERFGAVNALVRKEETAPRILYARYFEGYIIPSEGQQLPVDFSAISMKEAAAKMTQAFQESRLRDQRSCKALLEWIRLHRDWHDDIRYEYAEWTEMESVFQAFGQAIWSGDRDCR